MGKHIVFFDGECPFCHRSVRYLIGIDKEKKLIFAPLGGQTAKEVLSGPQKPLTRAQSIVLVENYQSDEREFYIRSRAIYRIYWIVGGKYKLLGLLSFLPCWISDFFYRQLAAHRHQFKLPMPEEPGPQDRFLP